jgi:hypothetical protein
MSSAMNLWIILKVVGSEISLSKEHELQNKMECINFPFILEKMGERGRPGIAVGKLVEAEIG